MPVLGWVRIQWDSEEEPVQESIVMPVNLKTYNERHKVVLSGAAASPAALSQYSNHTLTSLPCRSRRQGRLFEAASAYALRSAPAHTASIAMRRCSQTERPGR
jgi:hypothetical protein